MHDLIAAWGPTIADKIAANKIALKLRELTKWLAEGRQFGVLSAYGPFSKSVNQERNGALIAQLQTLGYRPIPLRGSWEGVAEKSVFVPNMSWADLVELGRTFNQDSVIFKHPSGTVGMYNLKQHHITLAVKADGEIAVQYEANRELYSKARGISFEFGFLFGQELPWDGQHPVTKDEVSGMLAAGKLRL